MSALFPNGLPYVVATDSSGIAYWTTEGAPVATVNATVLTNVISSSGAWTGGKLGEAISVPYKISNSISAGSYAHLPVSANTSLGSKGAAQHIMLIAARAFTLDNQASIAKLFGSNAIIMTSALSLSLTTCIKTLLESATSQRQIIGALVDATGPILDLSNTENKTLPISNILPSLHLQMGATNIAFNVELLKANSKTRLFTIDGPIPLLLTLQN